MNISSDCDSLIALLIFFEGGGGGEFIFISCCQLILCIPSA